MMSSSGPPTVDAEPRGTSGRRILWSIGCVLDGTYLEARR